jgi:hypothetical protein
MIIHAKVPPLIDILILLTYLSSFVMDTQGFYPASYYKDDPQGRLLCKGD